MPLIAISVVALNEDSGLKAITEENLEALNKIARAIRMDSARLIDALSNLTDVINRYKFK